MYKRYGKFQITDYMFYWVTIVISTGMGIWSVLIFPQGYYAWGSVLYFLLAIVCLWNILDLHRQWFDIEDDTIIVKKGKKEYFLKIPEEVTLIITDLTYPAFRNVLVPGRLKGRYALSIFKRMDMGEVINRIQTRTYGEYTMSTIDGLFEESQYIYSFVCNETLLDEIVRNRKAELLIPKSLVDKVSINAQMGTVYIDPKY